MKGRASRQSGSAVVLCTILMSHGLCRDMVAVIVPCVALNTLCHAILCRQKQNLGPPFPPDAILEP